MNNKKSVLNRQVSFFNNYFTTSPGKSVNLLEWLTTDRYKKVITDLRRYEKSTRKRKQAKLNAVTVSGVFTGTKEAKNLVVHSGLICIDIDQQDNPHLPNITQYKQVISQVPEVAYCGLSASGKSLYAILPIETPELHKEYFRTLELYFEKNFDLIIDRACKDVNRLRSCSYDPDFYINHNATVITTILTPENKASFRTYNASSDNTVVNKILNAVMSKKTDITAEPIDWYQICWVLVYTLGEDGRDLFRAFSQYHAEYSPQKCNKVYDYYLQRKYPFTVGTLIDIARKYNIQC